MEKYEKMELTPEEIIARLKKLKMILEDIEKKKKARKRPFKRQLVKFKIPRPLVLSSKEDMMRLSKIFLTIGISIIFALFVGYAMYVFYEPPKYYLDNNNTCYQQFYCENMTAQCYSNKTQAAEMGYPNYGPGPYAVPEKGFYSFNQTCYNEITNSAGYMGCLENRDKCDEGFQKTTHRYFHAKISFFILIAIAILALIAGTFVIEIEGISSGLIGGGILTIIWSLIYTVDFWVTWGKYVKLSALGLVLALLFYMGFKKFRKD